MVAPKRAYRPKVPARAGGCKSIPVQADVSKLSDTVNLGGQAYEQLGRGEILVNTAGIVKGADFWEVTESDYDAVLDVNLKGAFFLTQAFVKRLINAKL